MEAVYRLGKASVSDVRTEIPDPPSYSAVRAMLGLLQDKGYLRHEQQGLKYLYMPMLDTEDVRMSELKHTVKTFFGGLARANGGSVAENARCQTHRQRQTVSFAG